MIIRRASEERGHADHGWLDTRHTFSFADYYDPAHMGFRALRVINEDRVKPGYGFGTHSHRDMEIVSYVLEGELQHQDSLGTGSIIRPGDVQRMTAGTGVRHSETNPSREHPVHFLQIWILPDQRGLQPGYEQTSFAPDGKQGRLRLVASHDGREGSLSIHQDVALYDAHLGKGQRVVAELRPGRHAWIQVIGGSLDVNGEPLSSGDGAAISDETAVEIQAAAASDLLFFDLA